MTASPARILTSPRSRRAGRRAFTLLEVLIALAIFLLAMAVFGSMVVQNGRVAAGVEQQNLATRLCQSKMHEVAAGVVPMSSDGDQPFDEEPNYTWSMEADSGPVDGLWKVTITVKRRSADEGNPVQCALTQLVLDPSIVGSNEDVTPVTTSTATSSASTSSSSSTPSSNSNTPASSSPAPAAPAAPAANTPKPPSNDGDADDTTRPSSGATTPTRGR